MTPDPLTFVLWAIGLYGFVGGAFALSHVTVGRWILR